MKRLILVFIAATILVGSSATALTLKESIDIAIQNNPNVLSTQKKVEASSARLAQAIGSFFPTVKLDGSYGQSYTQPSMVQITSQGTTAAFTFGTDAPNTGKGWTASLSQPVFVAALFPGYQIAKKGYDSASEDLRKIILDTSYNVTVAYYGVLSAEKYLQLQKDSVDMAQSHVDQVSKMLMHGAATQADLARSQVQLANAEVARTKAYSAFEIAKCTFNVALGREVDEKFSLAEIGTLKLPGLPDSSQLIKDALAFSPSWRQFLLSKQVAEENVSLQRTAHLPTVLLSGQAGNRVTDYPTYKTDVNSWAVTGAASWTLFEGLTIQNRIREAAANLDAQRAMEIQMKHKLELEVKDAFYNMQSAVESVASAKKAVEAAEENQRVSTHRYDSGVGTNIDVIDAQVALTQTRINLIKAWFDIGTSIAKINMVVGKEEIGLL